MLQIVICIAISEAVLDAEDMDMSIYFSTIRIVVLCGEVVTMALRDRFVHQFPNIKLINLYSISECHDVAVADLSVGELEKVQYWNEIV